MGAKLRAAWDHTPLPLETWGSVAAAALVQRAQPLRLPAWPRPTGWMVVGGGVALVIAAVRNGDTGSLDEPGALVTRGLHGRSRNPMYLGFSMVQLGLAGATRNGWMLASFPMSAWLLHRSVLREERWLARFGVEYDAYRADVSRYWGPSPSRACNPREYHESVRVHPRSSKADVSHGGDRKSTPGRIRTYASASGGRRSIP